MAKYTFRGRLCGTICGDCLEPLSNVTVRLYQPSRQPGRDQSRGRRPEDDACGPDRRRGSGQESRPPRRVPDRRERRLHGAFGERYKGEAFEVDVYCGTVPHGPPPRLTNPYSFRSPRCSRNGASARRAAGGLGLLPARPVLVFHPRPVRRLGDLRPRHRLRRQGSGGRRQGSRLRSRLAAGRRARLASPTAPGISASTIRARISAAAPSSTSNCSVAPTSISGSSPPPATSSSTSRRTRAAVRAARTPARASVSTSASGRRRSSATPGSRRRRLQHLQRHRRRHGAHGQRPAGRLPQCARRSGLRFLAALACRRLPDHSSGRRPAQRATVSCTARRAAPLPARRSAAGASSTR